jgi:CheY-like chemotaxis protein
MKKTVLVVDDDLTDIKKIVAILEKDGYSVMEALTAEEALLKAQQTRPNLAIIDVVMPESDMTGFDICRKIKTVFQPNPPIVLMVTGKASAVNVSLAHQMGADGFEAKTSDMGHVARAVRDILPLNKAND